MPKLLRIAAYLYIAYALLIVFFIGLRIANVLTLMEVIRESGGQPLAAFIPMITLVSIGLVFIVVISVLVYCLFTQKNRILCLVFSAILLIGFPVGTVLGIFTLIVLTRAPVKEQFTG